MKNHVKLDLFLILFCISPINLIFLSSSEQTPVPSYITSIPETSDLHSTIGTKNAPIEFESNSGGYLKKVWREPISGSSYRMLTTSIENGATKYRDYNGQEVSPSIYDAVQIKIGASDSNFDNIPALVGSKYNRNEETYPDGVKLAYDSCSEIHQGVTGFGSKDLYLINYNQNAEGLYLPDITPGPSSDPDWDDDLIDTSWTFMNEASASDVNALLADTDDHTHNNPYDDGLHGTRIIYKEATPAFQSYDVTEKIVLKFNIDIPERRYTAISITPVFYTALFKNFIFYREFCRHDVTIEIKYEYNDGTTEQAGGSPFSYRADGAFWHNDAYFVANENRLNELKSVTISIFGNFNWNGGEPGITLQMNQYAFIGIDALHLSLYTYGDIASQVIYQFDAGIPYREAGVYGGVDLSVYENFNLFVSQIDYLEFSFRAQFPTGATIREFEFVKPMNPTAKNVDNDWVTLQRYTYPAGLNDIHQVIIDKYLIAQIISALSQSSTQSPNYQIGIRLFSLDPDGDENSNILFDYFVLRIHLYDSSEGLASSNLFYDRDDPSKIDWEFRKQVTEKWGLTPLTITFEDLPENHIITSSTWYKTEHIESSRKNVTLSITGKDLPAEAIIASESPNYLEQFKTFAVKEVMIKLEGQKTIILQTESTTFLKETMVRLNATCRELPFLGESGIMKYYLESNNEVKYSTSIPIAPKTNLRNFTKDINLNQIEPLEKGNKYDQLIFYINSNNPDEAGFIYLPLSFEIRKNDIVNPAFEWGDTYINYTFETNASSEYSVLVVQYNWEWHPEDYIFATNSKNYTANLTSGAILLSNMSIDFPYIFDNIDRHRTYPNPTFTFYFNNTDLINTYDVILDEVSVVPYFYYDGEPAKSRILFNRTDFEPVTIDPNAEVPIAVNFNYTQCNQTFQRGVYRLRVEFHETDSEHNSTYFNATLLMDGDYHDIGDILNFTTYEGLTGEQVIKGNFTKNPDTSAIACYIMDNEGYGDGTFLTFDRHGIFYGNQESPQVTIISPKSSEAYFTSLIPFNARVYDPDYNIDNASLHLFNEIWDLGWQDYPSPGEYHLMNLNPFDLTTGRIYVEVLARDLTLNYAFATSSFYCESYKDAIVNTTQIQIGSVNAGNTIQKVPCNVFVNFSNYDLLTRRIQLGSTFTDATNLKIQRNPLDVYLPEDHPDLGMSRIGDVTYWKFDYATENDTLTFSLNAPIVEWELDSEFSTSTRKVFGARIKRHTNLRTYTNVHIIGDFSSINFQNIRVYITDITGGTNISITNNCSLKYGYIGKHNDNFRVNFTVPLIIKGTDYAFKIAIMEDVSTEVKNYASGFFIGIMIGAVGAGVIRELVRILKKQPKPKGRSQILRFYLPAILIGVALGCVAGYFWLSG